MVFTAHVWRYMLIFYLVTFVNVCGYRLMEDLNGTGVLL